MSAYPSCRLALVLATLSCGGACETLPLLAPNDSTIDVVASHPVIPLNGESVITAVVTEPAGTPVQNGTLVTFATTLGTLDRSEGRTADGRASVRLVAGTTAGTATITAFSGNAISGELFVVIGTQ